MPGIDESLLEAMLVPGARGAALVDWVSGLALGTIGEAPGGDHEAGAAELAELARMTGEYTAFAATGGASGTAGAGGTRGAGGTGGTAPEDAGVPEDLIVTTPTCYHLVRFLGPVLDGGVVLHLWLDRDLGNLALARMRMRDLAGRLVL
ncbi:hypothetical protein [Streptomyces sp. CAU 1734]|uniref:hypothetical protein n=1 Tax=Streptomyces sp. CAU 1734 TaxID=3140360 RepID=UPI0032615B7D